MRRYIQPATNRTRPRRVRVLGLIAAALAAGAAEAATITVDTKSDTLAASDCSLRSAVRAANTNAAVGGCTGGETSPAADEDVAGGGSAIDPMIADPADPLADNGGGDGGGSDNAAPSLPNAVRSAADDGTRGE